MLYVLAAARLRRSADDNSEQSQALLAEGSSDNDSGVDENRTSKISEDDRRADDFVIRVDTSTGAVHYGNNNKESNGDLASMASISTLSRSGGSQNFIVKRGHFFHTVIFDCAGWTFIDTMGVDTMQQVNCARLD